jgi:antitoxin PrlF
MMTSTVSEKGQVTVPKHLRERLGIKAGDRLEFAEEGGRLVAVKTLPGDPVDTVYGILGPGKSTDEAIRALRGLPDAV